MRICVRCKERPISGRSYCRECWAAKRQEWMDKRKAAGLPLYNDPDRVRLKYREWQNAYRKKPERQLQHRAHAAVSYEVKMGRLIPQPCEVCGRTPTHAHHDDYSKPLDVRWLCVEHHHEEHK